MADHTVTAANVLCSAAAQTLTRTAGVALAAGQAVAKYTDGTMHLYQASGAAPINAFFGIALNNAAAGQPVQVCALDPAFTPGCALTTGEIVIGSTNAGNIAPAADLAAGMFPTVLGFAISTTQMNLDPIAGGVAHS